MDGANFDMLLGRMDFRLARARLGRRVCGFTHKRMRPFLSLSLLLCITATSVRAEDFKPEPGFISLINGKDLTGWRYKPDEKFDGKTEASDGRYTAKDGMIVVNDYNKETICLTEPSAFRPSA